MRTHTNIQLMPARRLSKQFNAAGNAPGTARVIPIVSPNTLHGNIPTSKDAMGMSGKSGIVSFIVGDGGQQAFTLYAWNTKVNRVTPSNGWILLGAIAAEYTKTCDQFAWVSFTIAEDVPFFIVAGTTPVIDAWVTGIESQENPNSDRSTDQ